MPRNEAQVRFELIDPALEERGWNRKTDIRVEETAKPIDIVNHQPRRRPTGRTDYVLRRPITAGTEPIPLGILEAKHEGPPPEHGLQQAKGYCVGKVHHMPFFFSSNMTRTAAKLLSRSRYQNFPRRKNWSSVISPSVNSIATRRNWPFSKR